MTQTVCCYESAQVASKMINAIKTTKVASMPEPRVRLATRGSYTFSWRLNGLPLTASTNRKSFTICCLRERELGCERQESIGKNKFITVIEIMRNSAVWAFSQGS